MRGRLGPLLALGFLLLPVVQVAAQDSVRPPHLRVHPPGPDPKRAAELAELREARQETIDRYRVRSLTQKRLSGAIELLEAGNYAEAREKLEKLNYPRFNPYERALSYRLLAYASFGAEDPAAAVSWFQKAVAEDALPIDDEASIRFNVAQIQASLEQWEAVEETLTTWFRYVEKPSAIAYYLIAISRYQRGMLAEALEPALLSLELSDEPREGWLQLVAALHLEREDFASAVPVLEELVARFPKKQYWMQLSLIYGAVGNYERSLRVQQIAYAQGFVTEDDELQRLARSYLYHGMPYPAAVVIERGIEDGNIEADREALELLGNCWIAAREYDRSLEPLSRAAQLAEDGRLYLRLAQVRVQREQWSEAAELLEKAIRKGGLDDVGKAQLLLGIAYYSDARAGEARHALDRAAGYDSTRAEARAWLDHIDRQEGAS